MIKVYKNYSDFAKILIRPQFFTVLDHYQIIFFQNENGEISIRQYADGMWGIKQ